MQGMNGFLRGLQGLQQVYSSFTSNTVLSGPANRCQQLRDSVSRVPCYVYDQRLRMLNTAANEGRLTCLMCP
jgi:hypothetical protein